MASCKSEEICSDWFIAQNNKSLVYIVNSCPRTCHQKSIKCIINSFGGGERNIPDPPNWLYLMQKAPCCITNFFWPWDLVVSVDFVVHVHCINLLQSPKSVSRQTYAYLRQCGSGHADAHCALHSVWAAANAKYLFLLIFISASDANASCCISCWDERVQGVHHH